MSSGTTLICPKCQAPIPVTLDDFKVAGCSVCGSISTLNKDGQLKVTHNAQVLDEAHQKLLKVGKQLQYHKITYTIAAVFVYHVDYKEKGSRTSGWTQEYGFMSEWYAYDDEGKELIIMKDTDHIFYLVSNPVPVQPSLRLNKRHAREFGKYQLYSLVGVDNEGLEIEGYYRIFFNGRYECADENFEKAAIWQCQLTRLSPVEVKRMMIVDEEDKLKAAKDFTTTTYYRNVFGFALFAILVLLIFNIGLNDSKVQTHKYLEFGKIYTDGVLDTNGLKPQLAGVFDLVEDQNYRFAATCYFNETNREVDYSLTLVREADAAVVADAALSFYVESGHDSDGDWEENLQYNYFKFQVEKKGKYQVFVAPDYESLEHLSSATLEIQIEPAPYTFLYLCVGSFFLLLWLTFQWQRENIIAFANLPHDTILHDLYESR